MGTYLLNLRSYVSLPVIVGITILLFFASPVAYAQNFIVTPNPVNIAEGTTATYIVQMTSDPGVTGTTFQVAFDMGDTDIQLVGPTGGTLNTSNWNIGVSLQIQALTDADTTNGSATFNVSYVSGPVAPPNYFFTANESELAATTTSGGTSGDPQDDPVTQVNNAVNLNTTRTISSIVSRQIFLQPVMPPSSYRSPGGAPPPPSGGQSGQGNGDTSSAPGSDDFVKTDDVVLSNKLAPIRPGTWNLSLSSSARYARTKYHDFNGSSSDRAGFTINTNHVSDRWSLDISVPVDIVYFDRELNEYDYWRIGAVAMPRYRLLDEDINGVEVTLGATAYYMRTTMMTSEFYDPDHAGLGALIGVRKTVGDLFTVSGGLMGQRAWNFDDRDEITGDDHVDIYTAGINIGAPVGDNLALNAMMTYEHIPDLPDWMDENIGMAGVSATYFLSDKWTLNASVLTDVFNNDERNVEVHMGLGWQF